MITTDEGPFRYIITLHQEQGYGVNITQGLVVYPEENILWVGLDDAGSPLMPLLFTIDTEILNDTFIAKVDFDVLRQDIIDGFSASTTQSNGWNNEIRDKIAATEIIRLNNYQFQMYVPHNYEYAISSSEIITATLPASIFTDSTETVITNPITIQPDGCNDINEDDVWVGECNAPQLISGDRERVVGFRENMLADERQQILDHPEGIICVPDYDFRLNLGLGVTNVISASTTQMLVGGPRSGVPTGVVYYVNFIAYNPSSYGDGDLAIHMYISNSSGYYGGTNNTTYFTDLGFSGGEAMWYSFPVTIINLSGTALGAFEHEIADGGKTIIIILTVGGTWKDAGTDFDNQRQNIINGLVSAQNELNGWNNEIKNNLPVSAVTRTSDTQVTITLQAESGYSISTDEEITVTVPDSALEFGTGREVVEKINIINSVCSIPNQTSISSGTYEGDCYQITTAGSPPEQFCRFDNMTITTDDWSNYRDSGHPTYGFKGYLRIPDINFGLDLVTGGEWALYFHRPANQVFFTTDASSFAAASNAAVWVVQFFFSANDLEIKVAPGTANSCDSLQTFFDDAGLNIGDAVIFN